MATREQRKERILGLINENPAGQRVLSFWGTQFTHIPLTEFMDMLRELESEGKARLKNVRDYPGAEPRLEVFPVEWKGSNAADDS